MYDKGDEDLMRYLAHDNSMLRALDDGKKVVLVGGTEFNNRVGKRTLRLCENCQDKYIICESSKAQQGLQGMRTAFNI